MHDLISRRGIGLPGMSQSHPRCRCICTRGLPSDDQRPIRPKLGEREQEAVLNWLRYDTKKAAAQQMYVTEHTLSTHIERVRRKYEAVGRPAPTKAAMLVRALQNGLVDLDDF